MRNVSVTFGISLGIYKFRFSETYGDVYYENNSEKIAEKMLNLTFY